MEYTQHSVDDALAAALAPGQRIAIGQGSGLPRSLIAALPRHIDRLRGSELWIGLIDGSFPDLDGVTVRTFFPSGSLGTAEALARAHVHYERRTLFELSSGFKNGRIPVDVALATAAPSRDGRYSLGTNIDYIHPAAERAANVIFEVSDHIPWTGHRSTIARRDGIFTVPSVKGAQVSGTNGLDIESPLADNLLRWIPNGATIELGMGKWFEPLIGLLARQRRGLRIHSGSLGQWFFTLLDAGAIDTSWPVIATAVAGTAAFYARLQNRCEFELAPAYITHHPETLRALPVFRAVNSVLEIDLQGQANSEVGSGGRRGGIGGLPDFARAAAANQDGLSIIALNATNGSTSRIVPQLASAGPSLTANEVDVVVTEYGSADLRGLQPDSRAAALIAIAAPEHRDALKRATN